jgi:hypothetical protein
MGPVLLGFLHVVLYCAVVIFVAVVLAWFWSTWISPIDATVYKWGTIIVGLLCLIAIISWLLGLNVAAFGLPFRY